MFQPSTLHHALAIIQISAPHVGLHSSADYHALRDADIIQKIFRWGRLLSTQFVPVQLHAAGKCEFVAHAGLRFMENFIT